MSAPLKRKYNYFFHYNPLSTRIESKAQIDDPFWYLSLDINLSYFFEKFVQACGVEWEGNSSRFDVKHKSYFLNMIVVRKIEKKITLTGLEMFGIASEAR